MRGVLSGLSAMVTAHLRPVVWAGPRSVALIRMAYEEEGLPVPAMNERIRPVKLLYPRSYVDRIAALDGEKRHTYCFMGALYFDDVYPHRKWIVDFARRHFTPDCYFHVTDDPGKHSPLGPFDHTLTSRDVFVPKHLPRERRAAFHDRYFQVMKASRFTLCPAGDRPWSMRFFEAILSGSIPIVENPQHTGRNDLERGIGYRYYLRDEPHVFRTDWVEQNRTRFLSHQTLIR